MIVKVKPLELKRWHGKTRQESFQQPITIRAMVDAKIRRYSVKLSDSETKRLEQELGINLNTLYNANAPHEFWDIHNEAAVQLENKTNVFDTSLPYDAIKVAILRGSSLVAPSIEEYENGLCPDALFAIYDEEEDDAKKVRIYRKRKDFIAKMRNMTREQKDIVLKILTGDEYVDATEDLVEMKIEACINSNDLGTIDSILNRDEATNFIHAMILRGVSKGVLRRSGNSIYYMSQRLGYDMDDAIKYLANDDNQAVKHQIYAMVDEGKKKAVTPKVKQP